MPSFHSSDQHSSRPRAAYHPSGTSSFSIVQYHSAFMQVATKFPRERNYNQFLNPFYSHLSEYNSGRPAWGALDRYICILVEHIFVGKMVCKIAFRFGWTCVDIHVNAAAGAEETLSGFPFVGPHSPLSSASVVVEIRIQNNAGVSVVNSQLFSWPPPPKSQCHLANKDNKNAHVNVQQEATTIDGVWIWSVLTTTTDDN